MKHLIIYAHPNEASLNNHFKQSVIERLQEGNHEIEVRDLYQLKFNPVLSLEDLQGQKTGNISPDIRTEQEFITWSDHITFIYPIWWTGMPAMMKGYIDRVMSYGFAYCYEQGAQKGLLTDKQTVIINTQGRSNAEYAAIGMDKALSLTSDNGIYAYCGLKIKQHFFFDNAKRPGSENIEQWTNQVKMAF